MKEHRQYLKEHEGKRFLICKTEADIDQTWLLDYRDEKYSEDINTIEINDDELIIEFDEGKEQKSTIEQRKSWVDITISNLRRESISFVMYDHGGKCPHIHLRLSRAATNTEKEAIAKIYAPLESCKYIDTNLCSSNHLIAVPFAKHWRHGTEKKLVLENIASIFNVDDTRVKDYVDNANKAEVEKYLNTGSGITAKIKEKIKITELAEDYGIKKGSNGNWYCPFHDDKNPSLSLDDNKGFKCFASSCKKKGNIVDFASLIWKVDVKEAIKRLKQLAGIFDFERFRSEILELLAQRLPDYDQATEKIYRYVMDIEKIYATRDDEKSELWIYKDGIYVSNGKTYVKEICREILGDAYRQNLVNMVVNKIEVDNYVAPEYFFARQVVDEIPCENGLLNVLTKEIRSYDSTKIFFTKIPIIFDKTKDCPNIIQFLREVAKNEADIPILEEFFGYCLLKDYRIQKAFMLIGGGGNGKTRVLEILKRFLGSENCSGMSIQEFERDNFAMSLLFGKLANISGDISNEALEYTGNFKTITGGDLISANRKFLSRISFINYAKQIYSANDLPKTRDLTDAFFRRWILLEFPYKFLPEIDYNKLDDKEKIETINGKLKYRLADPNVLDKIINKDELSGLLNRALIGLKRLLEKREFTYSKSAQEIKDLWLRTSDSFQAFCVDNVESDTTSNLSKSELRLAYTKYCNNHKLFAVSDKDINEHLTREYGATTYQDPYGKRFWCGIKLKSFVIDERA